MKPIQKQIEKALIFTLESGSRSELLEPINHWSQVVDFLIDMRVGGRFYSKLTKAGLEKFLPEPELERLRQYYHLIAIRNKLLFQELERVVDKLKALEPKLNWALIKGAGLIISGVYSPAERYLADLDFVVQGIEREEIREFLNSLGYIRQEHFEEKWWYEEMFFLKAGLERVPSFSVILEFHWNFRPLNQAKGTEIVEAILQDIQEPEYQGKQYKVPSPELQFYKCFYHGSAHHFFDYGYFWITLLDLSRLLEKYKIDFQRVIDLAQQNGLIEHLGIMAFILTEKLGYSPELWEMISSHIPKRITLVKETAQALWRGSFNINPNRLIHFVSFVSIIAKSPIKRKIQLSLEIIGLRRRRTPIQTNLENGFAPVFYRRVRKLNWELLRLLWQMAKFYRKIGFTIPRGD